MVLLNAKPVTPRFAVLVMSETGQTSHVRQDIDGVVVTASITNEAVDELKLAAGQDAYAVIQGIGRHGRDRLMRMVRESEYAPQS